MQAKTPNLVECYFVDIRGGLFVPNKYGRLSTFYHFSGWYSEKLNYYWVSKVSAHPAYGQVWKVYRLQNFLRDSYFKVVEFKRHRKKQQALSFVQSLPIAWSPLDII